MAEQTNRLVLIHFWGDGCPPCMMMERDVFPRPDVAAALDRDFVAVKINHSYFPSTAAQYGISAVPADVVITPQGQILEKHVGFVPAPQYMGLLTQVAEKWKATSGMQYAQMPSASPAVVPGRVMPRYDNPATASPPSNTWAAPSASPQPEAASLGPRYAAQGQPGQPAPPMAGGGAFAPPGYAGPVATNPSLPANHPGAGYQAPALAANSLSSPSYRNPASLQPGQPPIAQQQPGHGDLAHQPSPGPRSNLPESATAGQRIPEGNPPLALDGFCPVQLREKERWVPGNPRWGARHEGRTYLFAGPDEQKRFFEHPETYAATMSGNDVVLAIDQGQAVPGRRDFGAWYKGRMYLFSSEECYQRFAANPQRYAGAANNLSQAAPSLANRDLASQPGAGWQGGVIPAQAEAFGRY